MLSFQPKIITKDLLSELPDRSRKVLVDRFGLSSKGEERTLDAIGKEYSITRERVRQIENHGIVVVRESGAYENHTASFEDLKKAIDSLGAIVAESVFLDTAAKQSADRNHLLFLLTVGHTFENRREDTIFKARWFADRELADNVERALIQLYESIEPSKLTPEEEFIQLFSKELKDANVRNRSEEILRSYLLISKRLGKNPLGEWGRMESPHVRIERPSS